MLAAAPEKRTTEVFALRAFWSFSGKTTTIAKFRQYHPKNKKNAPTSIKPMRAPSTNNVQLWLSAQLAADFLEVGVHHVEEPLQLSIRVGCPEGAD